MSLFLCVIGFAIAVADRLLKRCGAHQFPEKSPVLDIKEWDEREKYGGH